MSILLISIIVFISAGLIWGFFAVTNYLKSQHESSRESLQGRINYLQTGFSPTGLTDNEDVEENNTLGFLNSLGFIIPTPTPEKLQLLNQAGRRVDGAFEAFVVQQIGFGVLGFACGAMLGLIMNDILIGLVAAVALAFLFYALAWQSVDAEAKVRASNIDRALPDLVDLFANACAAGTTFDIAADFILTELPEKGSALIIKEDFLLWQKDTKFGVERTEAWERLYKRGQSKNLKYFCNLMDQSEQSGGSVAESLLKMADFFRERKKQQIEAEIAKLASKLSMLTVAFIVLPILIFMILPIGIQVKGQMSGIF